MGGTIGMMLAARHPEAVGKLMVVDMVPFVGAMFAQPGTEPTVAAVTPTADMIYQGMTSSPREQYQARADAQITGMINTESARAGPLQDSRTSDHMVSAAAFRELIVTDLRPELSHITAPTSVLYVKFNDPRMTNEMADGIYRASFAALPAASLKRIDDSAHFIFLDQPEVFYRELDAFLSAE
jgi:pimeloyl-ACP methyl ester carboxylesterase